MLKNPVSFKSVIGVLPYMNNMHYIHIPAVIIKKTGGTFRQRFMCTVNGVYTFHGGFVALGEGDGYINISNKKLRELKLKRGDAVQIALTQDESKYGMSVSEELDALLQQDEEGFRRFEKLTAGKQRFIIHYVNGVKSSAKRLERSLMMINNLKKQPENKVTFRGLLGMEE